MEEVSQRDFGRNEMIQCQTCFRLYKSYDIVKVDGCPMCVKCEYKHIKYKQQSYISNNNNIFINKIKTKQMEDFVKTRANFYEIEKNFASITSDSTRKNAMDIKRLLDDKARSYYPWL